MQTRYLIKRRIDKNGVLVNVGEPDMNNPTEAVDHLKDAIIAGE
jgi:hypothetical protein